MAVWLPNLRSVPRLLATSNVNTENLKGGGVFIIVLVGSDSLTVRLFTTTIPFHFSHYLLCFSFCPFDHSWVLNSPL